MSLLCRASALALLLVAANATAPAARAGSSSLSVEGEVARRTGSTGETVQEPARGTADSRPLRRGTTGQPDLRVGLGASETTVTPLDEVVLTLHLRSLAGQGVAPEVHLLHADRLELVEADCEGEVSSGSSQGNASFRWYGLADDAARYHKRCSIRARVRAGHAGPFELRAMATCAGCAQQTAAGHTAVLAMQVRDLPDLAVRSIAIDPLADPGAEVAIDLSLLNDGTRPVVGDVKLQVPGGYLELLPADAGACGPYVQSGSGVSGAVSLGGGDVAECRLRFRVREDAPPELRVTATVSVRDDYNPGNNSASASTRVVPLVASTLGDRHGRAPRRPGR